MRREELRRGPLSQQVGRAKDSRGLIRPRIRAAARDPGKRQKRGGRPRAKKRCIGAPESADKFVLIPPPRAHTPLRQGGTGPRRSHQRAVQPGRHSRRAGPMARPTRSSWRRGRVEVAARGRLRADIGNV